MTQKYLTIFTALILSLAFASTGALAEGPNNHPCKQVVTACKGAGFARGQWKKGTGLMRDCVNPIMQGQTSVSGATKALPSVDPAVVSACKTKRARFGSGKVGS